MATDALKLASLLVTGNWRRWLAIAGVAAGGCSGNNLVGTNVVGSFIGYNLYPIDPIETSIPPSSHYPPYMGYQLARAVAAELTDED